MALQEIVVHDAPEPCPYLEGQTARMPLRQMMQRLTPADFDGLLAQGDRRSGPFLYRPSCPACSACEPLRLPVAELELSRSQRRVWKKNQDLTVEVATASFSAEKLALYNRHKQERGLARSETLMDQRGYSSWFLRSCTRTLELRYRLEGRLIGVSILDVGARDMSSVYFYFDPDVSERSLGTYSVLFEARWLEQQGGRYYYLGLWARGSRHIEYKSRFYPHERLVGGAWARFGEPPKESPGAD